MLKAMETPEEKRLRRIKKKEAKELRRLNQDYTNHDNPFGDGRLEESFIWRKKYDKQGEKLDDQEILRRNRVLMEESKRELFEVKKRRLEREKEMEMREEDMNRIQREKEMQEFKVFEKQEISFHLKQSRLRSRIRIKGGRAKPIDHLAQYYDAFTNEFGEESMDKSQGKTEEDIEDEEMYLSSSIHEPFQVLNGLRRSDLEDLIEDIKVYQELNHKRDLSFWNDMQVIVEDELNKLNNYVSKDRREGINSAVESQVNGLLHGKTAAELEVLKRQVEQKVSSREEGVDITFWETIMSKLRAVMAKARLKEKHVKNLEIRYERLKMIKPKKSSSSSKHHSSSSTHGRRDDDRRRERFVKDDQPEPSTLHHLSTTIGQEKYSEEEEEKPEEEQETAPELTLIESCKQEYIQGRYTPDLLPYDSCHDMSLLTLEEDERQRQDLRLRQGHKSTPTAVLVSAAESAFASEAKKGMSKDEVECSVEEMIRQDKSVMTWSDKYKPRKPRYFNRVHTGFEWNKYNQTHYDTDNPPPKIVQGYKFNLFYPDLIDKNTAPKYTIIPCKENKEFAIIRFSAGPPYQDIAFKIVNREWNYSHKSGFRSQFSNSILQLWFHFKRYHYRR